MREAIGKIIRLNDDGMGFVLEEGNEGRFYPFTFDRIDGYRGEYIRELRRCERFGPKGFRVGTLVKVVIEPHPDPRHQGIEVVKGIKPVIFTR